VDKCVNMISPYFHCNNCNSHGLNQPPCSCQLPDIAELGPIWIGNIADSETISKMLNIAKSKNYMKTDKSLMKFLTEYSQEFPDNLNILFYTLLDNLGSGSLPRNDILLQTLESRGYLARFTTFATKGIRTDTTLEQLKDIFV